MIIPNCKCGSPMTLELVITDEHCCGNERCYCPSADVHVEVSCSGKPSWIPAQILHTKTYTLAGFTDRWAIEASLNLMVEHGHPAAGMSR